MYEKSLIALPKLVKYPNTNLWKVKVNLINESLLYLRGQDNYSKTLSSLMLATSEIDLEFENL